MPFDRHADPIAITIPYFELLKNADGPFQRRSEPYIVSLAVDQAGGSGPSIDTNALPFPHVRVGSTVEMLGHGHLLYGPRHPGEWVALSVLFMESDQDLRDLGAKVESIVQSRATELAINAVLAAQPQYGTVIAILKELTGLVAQSLKADKDDELFRTEGVFLRDYPVPFDVNRSYVHSNEFIRTKIQVLPLSQDNGQAKTPRAISIPKLGSTS